MVAKGIKQKTLKGACMVYNFQALIAADIWFHCMSHMKEDLSLTLFN